MSNTVTRDHHNLRRNLNLNGNYISNDGGDEGVIVDDAGDVGVNIPTTITPSTKLEVFNANVQYSTGTAIQVDAGIVGSGTTFTSAMVGGRFVFDDGTDAGIIIVFNNAAVLTVSTSQTVGSAPSDYRSYKIYYPSAQIDIGASSTALKIGQMSLTQSEIDISSGDLTLDVAGDIDLSADGDNITFGFGSDPYYDFTLQSFKMYNSPSNTDDYLQIATVNSHGAAQISTVDASGNNAASLTFDADGDITFEAGANSETQFSQTTKTASGNYDNSLRIMETLDMDSGADGDDVHHGIWYTQTQTDLTGWDEVYFIYLEGGNKFTVDDKAQLFIDINDTSTIANTNKGIHIDIDSTGTIGGGSLTHTDIGLDIDINRDSGNGHGSSTTNTTGIDIDLVGQTNGTTTNTGINIAVSAADTNYALITTGGNVGIGVADPDQALEVNGDIHVENTVYFTAETANAIGDGATGAIDWNTSQKQKVTITGTGITCNFTDPAGACNLLLKVVQGDGSDLIATWDSDIKWAGGEAPTLSTGNGEIDIISFYWDGTNYFGVASLDFATP